MPVSSPVQITEAAEPAGREAQPCGTGLKASVIVPTHERESYLKDTNASLRRQQAPGDFEIIVVDNACSASLADYVRGLRTGGGPEISYASEPKVGLHNARHRGARQARGQILIYIDDDVLIPDGWLEAMLEPYADPEVGCVGGRVVLKYEADAPDWLSDFRAYLSEWDLGGSRQVLEQGVWPVGCNFSVRSEVLFTVGGFNPDGFARQELIFQRGDGECGLTKKIQTAGYKIVYEPRAWLYHRVPAERMTPDYLGRRMFIEGITSSYRDYRRQPRSRMHLLVDAGYQGLCRVYHILSQSLSAWGQAEHIRHRLAGDFRHGRMLHLLRLVGRAKLRRHVLRKDYLDTQRRPAGRKKQKVIVIFPPPYLDSSPGMRSLIERLGRDNFEVYVLTVRSPDYIEPNITGSGIHYLTVEPKPERGFPWRHLPLSAALAARAVRLAGKIRPDWVIGALPSGLLGASLTAKVCGARCVYFCLELHPSAEAKGRGSRPLKALEKWANRAADCTIIQDMYRGEELIRDHGLDQAKVLELPNAGHGRGPTGRGRYLQRRFGIPAEDRVVLYAGGIADWAESAELARASLTWPSDWHLVFHSPQAGTNDLYISQLRRDTDNSRLVFSLDPLPQEQMDGLVSSAHVGLAFYRRGLGLNNYLIGHSAGKICQYLGCGLPVVASDLPSLKEWIDRYQCGICVSSPRESQQAIQAIFDDYARYRRNARRCFEELLSPNRYLDRIVARLRKGPPAVQANPNSPVQSLIAAWK